MQSSNYVLPLELDGDGATQDGQQGSSRRPVDGSNLQNLSNVDEDDPIDMCPAPPSARMKVSGRGGSGAVPVGPPNMQKGLTPREQESPRGAMPAPQTIGPSGESPGRGAMGGAGGDGESRPTNYFDSDLEEFAKMPACSEVQERRAPHTFQSGAVYSGQWKGNARHGLGIQRWPDGASYEGEWSDNHADGKGCFTHSDGDTYSGEWKGNVAHGRGTYRMTDVSVYEGEWYADLQEGYGVESWGNEGTAYAGFFHNGEKEGVGVYYWADGSEYAGMWAENVMKGKGAYMGCDGRSFRGTWHESLMHGIGMYEWPDGQQYCGQYVDDQKDGFGIFVFPDGRRYEGYWNQGQPIDDDGEH